MSSTNRPNSSVQVKSQSGQLPQLSSKRLLTILNGVGRYLEQHKQYQSAMELMQKAKAQGKHLSGAQALRQIRSKTKQPPPNGKKKSG